MNVVVVDYFVINCLEQQRRKKKRVDLRIVFCPQHAKSAQKSCITPDLNRSSTISWHAWTRSVSCQTCSWFETHSELQASIVTDIRYWIGRSIIVNTHAVCLQCCSVAVVEERRVASCVYVRDKWKKEVMKNAMAHMVGERGKKS